VRSDIGLGGTFPDYALPDHTGTVRTLSELQDRDPIILTLAPGQGRALSAIAGPRRSRRPEGSRDHTHMSTNT